MLLSMHIVFFHFVNVSLFSIVSFFNSLFFTLAFISHDYVHLAHARLHPDRFFVCDLRLHPCDLFVYKCS